MNIQFSILELKKEKGGVVVPLLIGLGVVAVFLGVMVLGGKRNEKGHTSPAPDGTGFEGRVTILPTQAIMAGQKVFLTITSPVDGTTVSQNKVTVSGKTLPGAEVSVNEVELTAGADGKFSVTVSLEEGENPILITAGNEEGFEEKEITVYFEVR